MLEHPGVICYHAEYPSERVSEWIEIYATDYVFAHISPMRKAKGHSLRLPLHCDKITVSCFGDPDEGSLEILEGFGTTYHDTAPEAFVLHPRADRQSPI